MSEAPEDDVIDAPEVGAEEAQQPNPLSDIETAAKAGGWTPKDEWKGDPDKWVDAPQFVLKAAEILPNVTRELREMKKTLKNLGEHHSKTAQREYERAFRDIQERIAAAAASGDQQGALQAADDLVTLKADVGAPAEPDEPQELIDWKAANPWFGKDKAMTAATAALGDEAVEEGFTGKALIREVDRRLREKFPDKFAKAENPNRRLPAATEGATPAARRTGKSYSDLPADARSMADDFAKRGIMTKEAYAKEFFA